MMNHAEKARSLFMAGFNCAQSVFAAFCDVTGMDEETALRLSSSFGGGIGRMREVCGAVSGMAMVAGMVSGYADPKNQDEKAAHYALVQKLANTFKAQNGSVVCRDLLALPLGSDAPVPTPRDEKFYQRRPCAEFVVGAAAILDEWLENRA